LRDTRAMGHDRYWQPRIGIALIGVMAFLGAGLGLRISTAMAADAAPAATIRFGLCPWAPAADCVIDGDTFRIAGEKVRVADIDAPETHPSRCAEEARLGDAATLRLQALLNAGPVTLASIDRDTDRYGRKLRIVARDGRSLGDMLVAERLARRWTGHREPWC
jgi:micrococcal nuclease